MKTNSPILQVALRSGFRLIGICVVVFLASAQWWGMSTRPLLAQAQESLPAWAENGTHPDYPPETFLVGVGWSSSGLPHAQMEARLEIVRQIEAGVEERIPSLLEEIVAEAGFTPPDFRSRVQGKVTAFVERGFYGAEIVETVEVSGRYYALAVLNRQRWGERLAAEFRAGRQMISQRTLAAKTGKVASAINDLTQAYDISLSLFTQQRLFNVVSTAPPSTDGLLPPERLSQELDLMLSNLHLLKVSGDGQTGRIGEPFEQEFRVRLVIGKEGKLTPVEGIGIRFRYGTGEKIRDVRSAHNGEAAIRPVVRLGEERGRGRIIATPILTNLPVDTSRIATDLRHLFDYSTQSGEMPPVRLEVRCEDGIPQRVLKRFRARLEDVVTKLGFPIRADATIGVEADLAIVDVEKIITKFSVAVAVQVSVLDAEGVLLGAEMFENTHLHKDETRAIQRGVEQLELEPERVHSLLQLAQTERGNDPPPPPIRSPDGKPTLHALLVIMDADPTIGESTKRDLERVSSAIRTLEDDATLNIKVLSSLAALREGETIPRLKLLEQIQQFDSDSDDTLLVYYSGHGYMNGTQHYLALNSRNLDSVSSVSRQSIIDALAQKPGQLKLLITDCCSNQVSVPTTVSGREVERVAESVIYISHLLLEHEGLLNLSAADDGEFAVGNNAVGGYFTASLFEAFDSKSDQDADSFLSWGEVFEVATERVQKVSPGQTPKRYGAFPTPKPRW
jgi:hypothetical protein